MSLAESDVRFYDPTTGSFLTRDPLEAMTRSAYGYVYDNPLNNTDPLGLCSTHKGVFGKIRDAGCHTGNTLGNDVVDPVKRATPNCINNPFTQDDGCTSIAQQHPGLANGLQLVADVSGGIACVGLTFGMCAVLAVGIATAGGFRDADRECTTGDAIAHFTADELLAGFGIMTGYAWEEAGLSPAGRALAGGVNTFATSLPDIQGAAAGGGCGCGG